MEDVLWVHVHGWGVGVAVAMVSLRAVLGLLASLGPLEAPTVLLNSCSCLLAFMMWCEQCNAGIHSLLWKTREEERSEGEEQTATDCHPWGKE